MSEALNALVCSSAAYSSRLYPARPVRLSATTQGQWRANARQSGFSVSWAMTTRGTRASAQRRTTRLSGSICPTASAPST